MADTCPVVRVVSNEPGHPDGFVEINESDFDPAKHKLFASGSAPATRKRKKDDGAAPGAALPTSGTNTEE